jgi:simple sugar transport system permease protein
VNDAYRVGVAICFRARVINIGSEGQIAVGGIAASWIALNVPGLPSVILIPLAIAGGAAAGAGWASIAALMRLKRGVHEVLGTLLSNFVGLLLVGSSPRLDGRARSWIPAVVAFSGRGLAAPAL